MPEAAVALPPPSAGLKVAHVAIGRGTQNYTCADSLETTIPVATGAVATLYNGTCRAANYPEILAVTPGVELQFKPTDGESISPARLELSGHHYFTAAGVPAFDLNTPKPYGLLFGSKNASTPAPADALKGKGNQGFGAVPWLKLTHKEGSVGFQEVYRVNTAGGNPPPNCKGVKPGAFEVDYAAEYWLYN
ncbi:MAG: hypothetical protein M1825_004594 [Sarcosagium campestre]|nr:MAG: hypothetical protein M1825_004594 [Sarcosagium campestre]